MADRKAITALRWLPSRQTPSFTLLLSLATWQCWFVSFSQLLWSLDIHHSSSSASYNYYSIRYLDITSSFNQNIFFVSSAFLNYTAQHNFDSAWCNMSRVLHFMTSLSSYFLPFKTDISIPSSNVICK